MKKTILTVFAGLTLTVTYGQNLWKATSSKTLFFSEAPLENIEAVNKKSQGLINTETKQIAIIIPIIEFKFEKPLMEEHFNENYMETSKYKTASFQGKIISDIDFSTNGEYEATAEGALTIHGVKKEQKINGTITVKENEIVLVSNFTVALEDHEIEIPKMVIENLAEVIAVDVTMTFEPK